MCINGKKSLYIITRIGFVCKIPIADSMNLKGFLDSTRIAAIGLNHPKEFCKNICSNLIQIKPFDKLVAKLNHSLELPRFSAVAIIVYRHWLFL